MSEPLFKFKKPDSKKIGGLDVMDSSEWTLLIKPQIQDVTLFIHFHKLWNVQEQPEQVDADGNTLEEAVEAQPVYEFIQGFIKEDKFIVQSKKAVREQTFHQIQKRYILNLEAFINEHGYTKDYNNYVGDTPNVPEYYSNERTKMESLHMMAQQVVGARNNPTGALPVMMQAAKSSNVSVPPPKRRFNFLRNVNISKKEEEKT